MNIARQCAAFAVSIGLCFGIAAPAGAADEATAMATSCKPLTGLQRRILDRSNQGTDGLRHFVWRTRAIYDIDMLDVAQSLDTWRATAVCAKQVAATTPEHE